MNRPLIQGSIVETMLQRRAKRRKEVPSTGVADAKSADDVSWSIGAEEI
jgi:hypothetical protein